MLAQASQTHELLWAAILTGALSFVGVMVTVFISWSNHRRVGDVQEQVRPENGGRLGAILEQISKTVDAIDGRVHDGSKRTDRVETTIDRVEDKVDATTAAIATNSTLIETMEAKLDEHIDDTAPLVMRAKMEWGDKGTKDETK